MLSDAQSRGDYFRAGGLSLVLIPSAFATCLSVLFTFFFCNKANCPHLECPQPLCSPSPIQRPLTHIFAFFINTHANPDICRDFIRSGHRSRPPPSDRARQLTLRLNSEQCSVVICAMASDRRRGRVAWSPKVTKFRASHRLPPTMVDIPGLLILA